MGGADIKGNSYRTKEAQTLLSVKTDGSMILLVPEPGNRHDPNAIALLAAHPLKDNPNQNWVWVHVGYVDADVASGWMTGWAHSNDGALLVVEGELARYSRDKKRVLPGNKLRQYF
jgi:hypothetical protein